MLVVGGDLLDDLPDLLWTVSAVPWMVSVALGQDSPCRGMKGTLRWLLPETWSESVNGS